MYITARSGAGWSLLRQRGLAARDAKAGRGELRLTLPPGYCWGESARIEIDPDERVAGVIRLVFEKFRELGSAPPGVSVSDAGGDAAQVVGSPRRTTLSEILFNSSVLFATNAIQGCTVQGPGRSRRSRCEPANQWRWT